VNLFSFSYKKITRHIYILHSVLYIYKTQVSMYILSLQGKRITRLSHWFIRCNHPYLDRDYERIGYGAVISHVQLTRIGYLVRLKMLDRTRSERSLPLFDELSSNSLERDPRSVARSRWRFASNFSSEFLILGWISQNSSLTVHYLSYDVKNSSRYVKARTFAERRCTLTGIFSHRSRAWY